MQDNGLEFFKNLISFLSLVFICPPDFFAKAVASSAAADIPARTWQCEQHWIKVLDWDPFFDMLHCENGHELISDALVFIFWCCALVLLN